MRYLAVIPLVFFGCSSEIPLYQSNLRELGQRTEERGGELYLPEGRVFVSDTGCVSDWTKSDRLDCGTISFFSPTFSWRELGFDGFQDDSSRNGYWQEHVNHPDLEYSFFRDANSSLVRDKANEFLGDEVQSILESL